MRYEFFMKKLILLLIMSIPAALLAQADLSVCVGKGYTLNSKAGGDATGTSQVTYEWFENSSPVLNSNSASYTIAAGAKAAGDYAYVRKASNAECPTGVPSNTFTVRVRQPGTNGQSAVPCGCVEGLIICSDVCTTPHPTQVDGACVTGGCRQRNVTNWTVCGVQTSAGTRTDNACCQACQLNSSASCKSNGQVTTGNVVECNAIAQERARNACAASYNWTWESNACTSYYCY
jgi:hypothetical protein